jgi:hypothetical protein
MFVLISCLMFFFCSFYHKLSKFIWNKKIFVFVLFLFNDFLLLLYFDDRHCILERKRKIIFIYNKQKKIVVYPPVDFLCTELARDSSTEVMG